MASGTANFDNDVAAFAQLRVRLAMRPEERQRLLLDVGLDEARFEALEQIWDDRLMALDDEGASVPSLLLSYNEAFSAALLRYADATLSIGEFASATKSVQSGESPETALKRAGTTLPTFLRSHAEWTKRALKDDDVAEALRRSLHRGSQD